MLPVPKHHDIVRSLDGLLSRDLDAVGEQDRIGQAQGEPDRLPVTGADDGDELSFYGDFARPVQQYVFHRQNPLLWTADAAATGAAPQSGSTLSRGQKIESRQGGTGKADTTRLGLCSYFVPCVLASQFSPARPSGAATCAGDSAISSSSRPSPQPRALSARLPDTPENRPAGASGGAQ